MTIVDNSSLFQTPDDEHYFLTHSIGLMPCSTERVLQESYVGPWRSGAEDIWPKWLAGIDEFNQALAVLLNSDASQFCPQANVSSALSKVIMALPKRTGKTVIVASESDFPSAGFVLKQAEKLGYSLKLIPESQDIQSLSTWEKALSQNVHTVFITQVHYNTNKLIPVEDIASLCDARGITSIVDTAQATGIVPIDLADSKCDIIVGSCIKWLCGGPGAGFLWLSENIMQDLEPYDVGWFSHQNPFEFDIHNFDYADSASRFWGGTPSVAPYVAASNSIKLISKIGVENIRKHNRRLTEKLLATVPDKYVVSPHDLDMKGGTTVLRFDDQKRLEGLMREQKMLFDSRKFGMRISAHIYTSDHDIDCLIACIEEYQKGETQ